LNIFYVIGSAKQKAINVLSTSKVNEQNKERKKRKDEVDSL